MDHHHPTRIRQLTDPCVIFAPIVTRWYAMLEKIKLGSKAGLVMARVGLDQFALTPVMVPVFFSSMALMEGQGVQGAKKRVETSWWSTLQRNWAVFIPVQVINFAIVPAHLRIVLVNCVSLFWNAYLSYANSKAAPAQDKVKELIQ
ncbi:Protein required for ethanol metabolism [Microbotryomycetes sp. JL201]|nr:Protein required for ethanol metabolism [Microbotryomycetes sp. JL201]